MTLLDLKALAAKEHDGFPDWDTMCDVHSPEPLPERVIDILVRLAFEAGAKAQKEIDASFYVPDGNPAIFHDKILNAPLATLNE